MATIDSDAEWYPTKPFRRRANSTSVLFDVVPNIHPMPIELTIRRDQLLVYLPISRNFPTRCEGLYSSIGDLDLHFGLCEHFQEGLMSDPRLQ